MNSQGLVLIITVWILAILIVFVLGLGFRMSLEARLTDYNLKSFKLSCLVKAAVSKFEAVLAAEETPDYDSLNENWSNNEGLFKDIKLGEGIFNISYLREEEPSEVIFYGAMDEGARVNINLVPREILLKLPEITEDTADSILDWRDEDDIPHAGGAESAYYLSLAYPYSCKNGPFQSKEELLLVKDITPGILDGIKDLITVYGEGKINLNTANSEIIEVLGLTEGGISEIITYRAGGDAEEGTSDDVAFESIDNIKEVLSDNDDKVTITNLNEGGLIDVKTNYFRVNVVAKTKDGRITKKLKAVLSRSGDDSGIKLWYEY